MSCIHLPEIYLGSYAMLFENGWLGRVKSDLLAYLSIVNTPHEDYVESASFREKKHQDRKTSGNKYFSTVGMSSIVMAI